MEEDVKSKIEIEMKKAMVDYLTSYDLPYSKSGGVSMHDLTGNYDTLHGYMFSNQKEADNFKEMFQTLFPIKTSNEKL